MTNWAASKVQTVLAEGDDGRVKEDVLAPHVGTAPASAQPLNVN